MLASKINHTNTREVEVSRIDEILAREFTQEVLARAARNGVTPTHSVYELVEELTQCELARSGLRFACRPGCSACCMTLACCTPQEWRIIRDHIKGLERRNRRAIERHIEPLVAKWRSYVEKHSGLFLVEPTMVYRDWEWQPCIFLGKDGRCLVYEARPLVCRNYSSMQPCTLEKRRGKQFPFHWNQNANEFVQVFQGLNLETGKVSQCSSPLPEWWRAEQDGAKERYVIGLVHPVDFHY